MKPGGTTSTPQVDALSSSDQTSCQRMPAKSAWCTTRPCSAVWACRSRVIGGHRVILGGPVQCHSSKEEPHAMTAAHDVDWPAALVDRLTTTHLDVLCELLATLVHTLMGAEGDALCGAGYGERKRRAHRLRQRVAAPSIRQPHRVSRSRDPEATPRFLGRGLAAGTPHTCRAGPEHGRGDLVPARGVHPGDGRTRRNPGASPACSRRWCR